MWMFVMDWLVIQDGLERPVRLDSGGMVAVKDWRREEGRMSFRQEWRRRSGADEVEYWSGSGSGSYLCWCLVCGDVMRSQGGVAQQVDRDWSGGDEVVVMVDLVHHPGETLHHPWAGVRVGGQCRTYHRGDWRSWCWYELIRMEYRVSFCLWWPGQFWQFW